MTLLHILVFALLSLPLMWWLSPDWRSWGMFVLTLGGVFWLMTDAVFTRTDVLLFSTTMLMTVSVWWIQSEVVNQEDYIALGLMASLFVVVLLFMPAYQMSLLFGGVVVGVSALTFTHVTQDRKTVIPLFVLLILVLLIVLKYPPLALMLGQSLSEGVSSAVVWLGFSYVAFRLMALMADYSAGRVGGYSLRDVTVYILFFPAFTAGPIDRSQRFITELNISRLLDSALLVEGLGRIMIGVFKKFVIADSLALLSMSPAMIERTDTTAGLWILVYIYSFQIYFDFSGYSDVAIGLGRLYGITLPENFNRPYLQRNIQQFWQKWHMTLSTWFRVYYFIPLSRALITGRLQLPQWGIVLLAQLTTMVLIGLWHGISANFLLWGVWHGLGLFGHKLLADNTKSWYRYMQSKVWTRRLLYGVSLLTTFHFVTLSWVLFALPTLSDSVMMYKGLFGLCGTGC